MLIVAKGHVGQLELAAALDVDLLRTVDHDVGHGIVGEQRLDGAEAEHVGDQGFDKFALLDKIQLNLGFDQQVLDPAGQLRLEGRARHLGGGSNVHVLDDERLDLRFRRLDRRPPGIAPSAGGFGLGSLGGRVDQGLDQRGDQIATVQRVCRDAIPQQIGLHRGVDNFGKLAAAEDVAALRPDVGAQALQQLLPRHEEAILGRGAGIRRDRRDRVRSGGIRNRRGPPGRQ